MQTTEKIDLLVAVKQFITNKKGKKVAAILDIKELARIEELIEDLSDRKTVEDRLSEDEEDYEAYRWKRRSERHV